MHDSARIGTRSVRDNAQVGHTVRAELARSEHLEIKLKTGQNPRNLFIHIQSHPKTFTLLYFYFKLFLYFRKSTLELFHYSIIPNLPFHTSRILVKQVESGN